VTKERVGKKGLSCRVRGKNKMLGVLFRPIGRGGKGGKQQKRRNEYSGTRLGTVDTGFGHRRLTGGNLPGVKKKKTGG